MHSQDKAISNYALIRAVETNNKLYSGLVNLAIPIYDVEVGGGLMMSSSLTYESNGFRPHVEPDLVGLNWNVNLFGKITRESSRPLTRKHSLYYNYVSGNEQDCFKPSPSAYTKKILLDNPTTTSDSYFTWITDKYYFDFFGYNGYFVIDHNGQVIVFCENANITVNINNLGCQPLFGEILSSEITLKDDKGNSFIFGGTSNELEINYHQLDVNYSENATPNVYNTSVKRNVRTNYIVGWNLKKVILNNGRTLTANYQNSNKSILNSFINEGKNVTTNFNIQFPDKQTLKNNNLSVGRQSTGATTHSTRSVNDGTIGIISSSEQSKETIYSKLSILENIDITDIGKINFEYNETLNPLELTKLYLKRIKVLDINNSIINDIILSYNDLGGNYKRTFLKSIINKKKEEYVFDYYKTTNFPQYDYGVKNKMGFWNGKMSFSNPENLDPEIFKAGLLRKVIFPTRGYKEFFYEPHRYSMIYNENNQVDNVAESSYFGARVYKEINNDDSSSYERIYEYKDSSNKSTGILDQGIYQKPTPVIFMNPNGLITYSGATTVSSENLAPNMYSLDLIHYTEVQEQDGRGKKRYFYSNRKTHPDQSNAKYFKNPNFHGVTNLVGGKLLSKEYERGKLMKLEIKDSNNTLKILKEYQYKSFVSSTDVLNEPTSTCLTCKIKDNNFYVFTEGLPSADGIRMYVPVLPYLLDNVKTTEYFGDKTIINNLKNVYNERYLYWHPFPVEEIASTEFTEISKKNYYPGDLLMLNSNCIISSCSDNNFVAGKFATYKNMLNDNIISPIVILEKNSKGKNSLSEYIYNKDLSTFNTWQIGRTTQSHLNSDFSTLSNVIVKDIDYYQLYDSRGNLLQKTSEDGIPITTLWGYHQTQPIVKIEGATYAQVMEAFNLNPNDVSSYLQLPIVEKSNLDTNDSKESELQLALTSFQKLTALKNYTITTYTYDPLIGVKSITSSSGIRESYKYDDSNRLSQILNGSDNIIKEYKYNYAPIKYFNIAMSKSFVRNDCGYDAYGSTYNYMVPASKYMSIIDQADADQLAQNEIDMHGQNTANIHGICNSPAFCSFNPENDINGVTSTIERLSDIKVKVQINIPISLNGLNSSNSNLPLQGFFIGEIADGCQLISSSNQLMAIENGRKWIVTMGINGSIYIKLFEGAISPSSTSAGSINLNFEYNINDSNSL